MKVQGRSKRYTRKTWKEGVFGQEPRKGKEKKDVTRQSTSDQPLQKEPLHRIRQQVKSRLSTKNICCQVILPVDQFFWLLSVELEETIYMGVCVYGY